MSKSELMRFFDERFGEIEDYLTLLREIEAAARTGPPRIEGSGSRITAAQQKILYSGVYLQLYNLVEATVSRCIEAVADATCSQTGLWRAEDLNSSLQREWIRYQARTHIDLAPDKRLERAVDMCKHIIEQLPINDFDIEIGGGGNWDDDAIEKVSKRLGCELKISRKTRSAVKRHVRDDLGALKLVKNRRNGLAHGSLSFVECADGVGIMELGLITEAIGAYLREAIECFSSYISVFGFLRPESKPAGAVLCNK